MSTVTDQETSRGLEHNVGRKRIWKFRLTALALGISVAALLLEVGIRIALTFLYRGSLEDLPLGRPTDPKKKIASAEILQVDPNPRLAYRNKPGACGIHSGVPVCINAHGFRDEPMPIEKSPETLRVIGLGDSTMFGFGVFKEERYLDLLQAELRHLFAPKCKLEFINTGVIGYNGSQEVETFLKHGLQFKPDVVLIQFDVNDLMPLWFKQVKPDYLWARHLFLTHLPNVFTGKYSGPAALYILGQHKRLNLTSDAFRSWETHADAYRRLATTCRQHDIPLLVLSIYEELPMIRFDDEPTSTPGHAAITALCRELNVPLIQTLPRAKAYMHRQGSGWLDIINGTHDTHPNRIGHALIAQAALPALIETVSAKLGVDARTLPDYRQAGNTILRQISQKGLYQTEDWSTGRINWTTKQARFEFIPAGRKLIVPLLVPHQDASTSEPVQVTLRVDGTPTAEKPKAVVIKKCHYVKPGYYTEEINISDLAGCPLELTLIVNRRYRTETDPRKLGVAVYPLKFRE